MALDVAAIDPDFMVASGYKWLLCPYAFTFLYVATRHHGGQPIEHYTWTLTDPPAIGMMRGDDMDGAAGAGALIWASETTRSILAWPWRRSNR